MPIQPSPRAPGSSLRLRFNGNLAPVGAANLLTYPQVNGALPADLVTLTKTGIRFLFADATDPNNGTKKFPPLAFDDSEPAGAAPHAPWTGAIPNILSATDQIIGKPYDPQSRAWTRNIDIRINALAPDGVNVLAVRAHVDEYVIVLDGTNSGLGLNTGLPVLVLPMTLTFPNIQTVSVPFDMVVTINHSKIR